MSPIECCKTDTIKFNNAQRLKTVNALLTKRKFLIGVFQHLNYKLKHRRKIIKSIALQKCVLK